MLDKRHRLIKILVFCAHQASAGLIGTRFLKYKKLCIVFLLNRLVVGGQHMPHYAPCSKGPESTLESLRKGRHRVEGAGLDQSRERRHRAGHISLGDEAHDTNHREAPVVDLHEEALCLFLL